LARNRKLSEQAFTLIELLCIIALLSLMVAIARPVMQNAGQKYNLKIAARTMATDMRRCQQTAIATGVPYCMEFIISEEFDLYHYRIKNCQTSKSERVKFPEGVKYRSTTFRVDGGFPKLRFKPNGAPNYGGTVVLTNNEGKVLYVIVTPATGRVRISPDPPDHWDVKTLP